MSYRTTDAPDSSIVKIELSIGQMKVLEKLVGAELGDAERGYTDTDEKTLQTLCDIFWAHVKVERTPEEEAAHTKPYFDAIRAGNAAFNEAIATSRNGASHE
ncbi:MAG: hypothetical protein V4605_04410 [Pseudomonadota bacterium]